ncbi:GNAT family N-acetyltransferase [Candidatus Sumerlaeota bacterium]|nr:GNAT family N-acetyltransferase [Candidatus Sumerlaeota bacterium]
MNASFVIRRSASADRDEILRFSEATGVFRPDEIEVAREVLDEALAKGDNGPYLSYTAEVGGRAAGWVCFGPTPCTLGTYDIYWLAVAPDLHGQGLGQALMTHAERTIREIGGRLAVVETSSRAAYDATRRFYVKFGYPEAARLADFYAPGDDKVIYIKRLSL